MLYKDSVVSASEVVHITPEKPLVKLGSSLALSCSASCLTGKPTWIIISDSVPATATNENQHSVLTISRITRDYSRFKCEAKCGGKKMLASVQLYYFSDLSITADPKEPVSGQQFQLKCGVDVHPEVEVDLKLKHEETVIAAEPLCKLSEDGSLKHCEVSAAERTEATRARYQCKATLQIGSSQHNETADLQLNPKAARSVKPPVKVTSPPTEPQSTAAMSTETVPVQTERPHVQSTAAIIAAQSSKQGVIISVPVVILVSLAIVVGMFCYWKKRKTSPPQ
ncbi:hypothetical protein NFI96_021859 [Prochilodus magdalenae]|nr:hypothetical protein NFI96_021859 [Prochilodus magdalenae]